MLISFYVCLYTEYILAGRWSILLLIDLHKNRMRHDEGGWQSSAHNQFSLYCYTDTVRQGIIQLSYQIVASYCTNIATGN